MTRPQRIVPLGFMASGKTSVAQLLGRLLECDVVDLDELISHQDGRRTAQIIRADGEAAFRTREAQALKRVLADYSVGVIALGGGTWMGEENRKLIQSSHCISVWLDVPFELCWERLVDQGAEDRPLITDCTDVRRLYNDRRLLYRLANIRIRMSRKKSAELIASEVLRRYHRLHEHVKKPLEVIGLS
ncbi:MAG TPA: shikimate kinase [Pyrinomonadaceae bacterium]|nr:shikimate kinase [Pyrinomonadaceae bacterium]